MTSKLSDQGPVRSRSATGVSSNNGGDEKSTIYRSPSTSSIDSITPEVQVGREVILKDKAEINRVSN